MKLEKWNPSIKALTILICVILLSFQYLITLNLAVFLISILLLIFFSNARLKSIVLLLCPATFAAFGLFMMGLYYAKGSSISAADMANLSAMPYALRAAMSTNLLTALQLSTRMLAFAGVGILFALSTDGELFIASLIHQAHVPPKFAYGVLAAVHLMPNMVREFAQVRLAYRVRGVKIHAFSIKPVFTMLVNCIRWSESVSMAMESRGFSDNAERTYYTIPKVHAGDIIFAAVWIIGIILGMFLLKI